MRGRVFLFSLIVLSLLSGLTRPTLVRSLLAGSPTATTTATPRPPTFTPSPTRSYFAHVPTATPLGGRGMILQSLPSPALGELPPTFTPRPTATPGLAETPQSITVTVTFEATPAAPWSWLLPDSAGETAAAAAMLTPDRLQIPRLALDAPIEPAATLPSAVADDIYEWAVPDHRAAGWLTGSAPLAQPGNTVLAGHHNVAGEVFRDIWTLQAGDEIVVWAGDETRVYQVMETLILPERDQPLEVRLANARYIQPTPDERLTLITCWPYEDNSHRAVVIARPVVTGSETP